MTEPVMLTWDQLEARGQLKTHTTPGNIVEPCYCGKCATHFSCSHDYKNHLCTPRNTSKQKLTPTDLDRLLWRAYRRRSGEWIFSNQATYLLQSIINGNNHIGQYDYWLGENNKFIGRRKTF